MGCFVCKRRLFVVNVGAPIYDAFVLGLDLVREQIAGDEYFRFLRSIYACTPREYRHNKSPCMCVNYTHERFSVDAAHIYY